MDLFIKKGISYLLLTLWLIISIQALTFSGNISSFIANSIKFPLLVEWVLIALIIITILGYSSFIRLHNHVRHIIVMLWIVLVLLQAISIIAFNPLQVTDAYMIRDQALALAQGLRSTIEENFYFQIYHSNNFLLLIFTIVYKILIKVGINVQSSLPFSILGAVMLDCAILLTCAFAKKVSGEKCYAIVLFLFTLNPLTYLLLHWNYTVVFSLPIGSGIIYLFYCIKKGFQLGKDIHIVFYSMGIALLSVLGYFMRPTAMIPTIAIAIYGVLHIHKARKKFKILCISLIASLVIVILTFECTSIFIKSYNPNGDKYVPISHYIMMGLHGDGEVSAKDIEFTSGFETREQASEAVLGEIKQTIHKMGIGGLINHTVRKMGVTWAGGINISNYIGSVQKEPNIPIVYNYTVGGKKDAFNLYVQAYYVSLLILVLMYLLTKTSCNGWSFVIELSLLGGILFYFIWEAKPMYSVPFWGYIIILVGLFLTSLSLNPVVNMAQKQHTSDRSKYYILAVAVFSLLFASGYTVFCGTINQTTNNLISCSFCEFIYVDHHKDVVSTNQAIKQSFCVYSPFNRIQIHALPIDTDAYIDINTEYSFSLYDDHQDLLFADSINRDNIINRTLTIDLNTIHPERKTVYTIEIKKDKGEIDTISWEYIKALSLDQYDGDGYIGNTKSSDLDIRIQNITNEPYLTLGNYIMLWIICISLMMVEINEIMMFIDMKR